MKRHAFTLIEVLVAILLLSMVMSVLFLGTYSISKSWERIHRQASEFEEILVLDRAIDNMFSNIIPFRWPSDEESIQRRELIHFDGQPTNTVFAYLHKVNRIGPVGQEHRWEKSEGGIRFCHVTVEEDELVAYYCNRPPFPEDLRSERLSRSVLSQNVASVAFTYLDLDQDALDWVDDWEDRDYLPLAVRLSVKWADGRADSWLRRTAGSGFFEHYGIREMDKRKFVQ